MTPTDIPARIECWGAFAPSRQSPETMKERALAGTPLRLVTRSLRSGSSHAPNHAREAFRDADYSVRNSGQHEDV